MKYLSIIIFLSFLLSCGPPDRCQCDSMQNMGSQTDSVRTSTKSGYDVNAKIIVEGEIKKIIDAGVTANYENHDEEVKTRVNTIVDKFPEITYLARSQLDMYCRDIQIKCKDKSLDDAAFLKFKGDRLSAIGDLIQKELLKKINGDSAKKPKEGGNKIPNPSSQKDRPVNFPKYEIPAIDTVTIEYPDALSNKSFEIKSGGKIINRGIITSQIIFPVGECSVEIIDELNNTWKATFYSKQPLIYKSLFKQVK